MPGEKSVATKIAAGDAPDAYPSPLAWRVIVPGLESAYVEDWDIYVVNLEGPWWFWTVIDENAPNWHQIIQRGSVSCLADAKIAAEEAFRAMQRVAALRPVSSRRAGSSGRDARR